MKAVYYARFGGPEVLQFGEMEDPTPARGEVLIRVRAAGVNPVDWKLRAGEMKSFFPFALPVIPGWDAAGEVVALGAYAKGFAVGDRVMAYCRKPKLQWGCYAEYVTMDAGALAKVPAAIDMDHAATLPLAGLTAWQSLVEVAGIGSSPDAPGESPPVVAIFAAAGGVGSLAVPLAKARGAIVIGVCGPDNMDYVAGLGADHVVNYREADPVDAIKSLYPQGVNVIVDSLGEPTLSRLYALVARGGHIIGLNQPPDPEQCKAFDLTGTRLFSSPNGKQLTELMTYVADGRVPIPPITRMPLKMAAEAHRISAEGHTRGKIVLMID